MPGPLQGFSNNGWAVWGNTSTGTGTVGTAGNGTGAYGDSRYGDGVVGKCIEGNKNGVRGESRHGTGVRGESLNGYGVYGEGRFGTGVYGYADSGAAAVYGYSRLGIGVQGQGPYAGLWGRATGSGASGVRGASDHGSGVYGEGNFGVFAYRPTNRYAGWFLGDVYVTGYLTKAGGGFRIDHPRDPANKYLNHSFVESSEMKTMYDGIVTLDENGEARVDLPEWFEAVNGDDGDLRYQLTAVGRSAPNLHVAEEIYENRFRIAGGEGGMKVCWQLTGSRKDPWAAAYPLEVEQEKPQEERGRYLHPHLYNASEDQMINPPQLLPDNGEAPSEPLQVPQMPETPPGTPPGFGAPGFGYPSAENTEELRGQIEELRRQIEELKRRG